MASNPYSILEAGPSRDTGPSTSASTSAHPRAATQTPKKKKNKGGRKNKRPRRKSFATVPEEEPARPTSRERDDFYLKGNTSDTSLDSEVLLDHRDQYFSRARRSSTQLAPSSPQVSQLATSRIRTAPSHDDSDGDEHHEGSPLLSNSGRFERESPRNYGSGDARSTRKSDRVTRQSSSRSSKRRNLAPPTPSQSQSYNINYPPSIPGTPPLGPSTTVELAFGDVMRDEYVRDSSRATSMPDMENDPLLEQSSMEKRNTIAMQAEEDVCFPQEGLSELGDDEHLQAADNQRRRHRRKKWPDLSVLEEWYRLEKEGLSENRIKKITEPQLINGRLRPVHKGWYSTEEDAPYRFTYFNEEFQSTIHSQTISGLVQPDAGFKELFIPEPPILSDSTDDEDEEPTTQISGSVRNSEGGFKSAFRQSSLSTANGHSDAALSPKNLPSGSAAPSREHSGENTPKQSKSPLPGMKSPPPETQNEPRYGERPVWWLDVLSPTEREMRYLSRAFGIHPLTAEDILLQEQREKVELFRHYYFVNYRTFDQDENSDKYLEPVNMYVVVFKEGVISFHFSQTPHPANVRRRIRQLRDFMILSADWISYAIIDDITDVYLPLIQNIEDEVDEIDDAILQLHSSSDPSAEKRGGDGNEKNGGGPGGTEWDSSENMLRRVGDCRKKVMRLYRLLGNKADVIKGFAKRCNEHWQITPRSEIGLYLGDIQDHIVTMTGNLSHYEAILARCHQNYIAQINIRMNERSEQTADGLNKLTVLGTIVLPMNIITGLWGMNVWVPGQEYEGDLVWFFAITVALILFGISCYLLAKRVYRIV
ncbi:CorA metal ion transporter [Diatrype stigma]|uniref:CorA metal ion transporter n=1 Tax=Diatrype stigma TaxID=117547 RepID=A0AAN9USQ9_9PEZI